MSSIERINPALRRHRTRRRAACRWIADIAALLPARELHGRCGGGREGEGEEEQAVGELHVEVGDVGRGCMLVGWMDNQRMTVRISR